MFDLHWSQSEKKIARAAYEAALQSVLATTVAEFKAKAAAVTSVSEMWDIEDHLRETRKDLNFVFDYRYSRLPLTFARLIRDGYLDERQLAGLSEDKWAPIRHILTETL